MKGINVPIYLSKLDTSNLTVLDGFFLKYKSIFQVLDFRQDMGRKYKENPNLLYMMRLRSLLVLKPYQYGYLRWVA